MTAPTIAAALGILLGLAAGALLWRGRGSWDRADRAVEPRPCSPDHRSDVSHGRCVDQACPDYGKETRR